MTDLRATVLRGRVVTPDVVIPDGAVAIDHGTIRWVGPASQVPEPFSHRLGVPTTDTLLPGLVDIHCHGGAGASFPDAQTLEEVLTGAAEHLRHGTTSLVGSLVTASPETLVARAGLLADAVEAGALIGIHAEGPFLSHHRRGAQSPDDLLPGDPDLVRALASAARGHLVTMTLAPDVPGVVTGADDVLAALAVAGVLPSFGHTDASAEQVEEALARAATLLGGRRPTATHLFNGMRPLHHRDPGPVAACLAAAARGEAVVELIADGTHLADATVRMVFALVGPHSIALVTDAMAAAGLGDGAYALGPMQVLVADGTARIISSDGSTGSIAGGVSHLLDVVRRTVRAGVPLVDAVHAASTTPASVLGRQDVGGLVAGRRADILVTDDGLLPLRVLRSGVPVT